MLDLEQRVTGIFGQIVFYQHHVGGDIDDRQWRPEFVTGVAGKVALTGFEGI